MGVGKPLQLRLFLEGEEVPVISGQISIGMNAPAAASIQVVPLDEAMDLKPRTMVHLFFLDSFEARETPGAGGTRKEADRLNIPFLSNYKLLFSGEIVGFQFVKAVNSRAIVLQCLDFSSYWDAAHATAVEYGPNGNAFTHQGALRGSNTGLFDDIVNTTSEQLVNWLRKPPKSEGLKNITGLAGGVIHMLEQIGGVPGHTRGVNDFFTVGELRCRVLAQIVAEENDNTAANLLKVSVFDEWLRNGLQNIGQQISFRDMLKLLFGYVKYDVVPNPAAKFDETVTGATTRTTRKGKLFELPQGKKAISDIEIVKLDLGGVRSSTDSSLLFDTAKRTNIRLKNVGQELTRLRDTNQTLSADIDKAVVELFKAVNALSAVERLETAAVDLNAGFIPRVLAALDATLTSIRGSSNSVTVSGTNTTTGSSQRLRAQIIRPDCFFAPPPRCNVIFPEQYTQLSYDRNYLAEVTRSLVLAYNTLVGKEALLADRYLAPSVGVDTSKIVVKPGKDGYRALMQHELHTGIIPRSEWLPNISSFSSNAGTSGSNLKDERSDWAAKIALFHFFKFRFGPRQAAIGGRFNPYLVCGFPALIILRPFIVAGTSQGDTSTDAKVIDFMLNQSQSGGGNPIAPSQLIGMIASLSHNVDQGGGSTSVSMNHVRQHLGVDDEFLGVFLKSKVKVKKRIQVVLNATRLAKSDKERLKSILIGVTPQVSPAAAAKKASKRTLVDKTVESPQASVNPKGKGKVTAPSTSTFQVMQEAEAPAAPQDPPLTVMGKIEKSANAVLVPMPDGKVKKGNKGVFGTIVGVRVTDPSLTTLKAKFFFTAKAASTPGEIPETSSDPNQQFSKGAAVTKAKAGTTKGQVYQEVILYEEVDLDTQSHVPIEEIIRPKWFSEAYTNSNIGKKIYEPFFGVPSIIDEAAFDGLGAKVVTSEPPLDGAAVDAVENKEKVIAKLIAEEEARAKISIERSVNYISYVYGLVKAKGLDVDEFIRQYSNRPIATLPQMLGDPDLELSVDSSGKTQAAKRAGTNVTPQIGFHSLAINTTLVNSKTKMAGLLDEPTLHIQRINNTGKAGPIPPEYDVRKEKKDRVSRYIAALGLGPGFRG